MEKIIMEKTTENKRNAGMNKTKINPLREERIFVRFIPRESGYASNIKGHVLEGGMADGSTITLCVPILRSTGTYKNVLTNEEKDYLEDLLGLDSNALSVYKKEDNYWDNYRVTLTKEGLHLDLSNPEHYIKYKVLLANSEIIAPSMKERMDRPKVTYRYELVKEDEESSIENAKMDATMACYKEFGKIEDDVDTMRVLVELADARPYAPDTKPEFLRSRINMLIQADPKIFLKQISDPLLHAKVLLRRSVELGKVTCKADYYYLASDGSPMCEANEKPTLSVAAAFLNLPAHQDIKFMLESEVSKN